MYTTCMYTYLANYYGNRASGSSPNAAADADADENLQVKKIGYYVKNSLKCISGNTPYQLEDSSAP